MSKCHLHFWHQKDINAAPIGDYALDGTDEAILRVNKTEKSLLSYTSTRQLLQTCRSTVINSSVWGHLCFNLYMNACSSLVYVVR